MRREPYLVQVIHEILIIGAAKVLIGADFRSILQTVVSPEPQMKSNLRRRREPI
jgi:hypothetical protein